jgi:hypothetical protein
MLRTILLITTLAAGIAQASAHPGDSGPPGPPPPHGGAPSPEALATVPGLDAAQQTEVRKLLLQRRDAHEALRTKEDAERDAMKTRYRTEHERIDDESAAKLRKLLGDDGYRNLAGWLMSRGPDGGPRGMRPPGPDGRGPDDRGPDGRGPGAPGPGNRPPGPDGRGPNTSSIDPAPSAPSAPDPSAADDHARVR